MYTKKHYLLLLESLAVSLVCAGFIVGNFMEITVEHSAIHEQESKTFQKVAEDTLLTEGPVKAGKFMASATVTIPRLHATHYRLKPDDCVLRLWVNGQRVYNNLPVCGHQQSVSLALGDHILTGANTIKAELVNFGEPTGIELKPDTWGDPLLLSLTLLIGGLLTILLLPLIGRLEWHTLSDKVLRLFPGAFVGNSRLIWYGIASALLAVVISQLGYQITRLVIFEWQGPFSVDSPLYWGMGKAIVSGAIPYLDLFETKPPGIFLISALSYAIGGGPKLASMLQALVFGFMPAVISVMVWQHAQQKQFLHQCIVLAIGLIIGGVLTLYSAFHSGLFQVESFGAFAALLYLLHFQKAYWFTTRDTVISGLLLLGAIGLKEPFVLTTAAAVLVLNPDWKTLQKRFLLPLGVAAFLGIAISGLLGYLIPYLTIYLPEMLGDHIHDYNQPFWRRFDAWERLWIDIRSYNFALSIAITSLGLWAALEGLYRYKQPWHMVRPALYIGLAAYFTMVAVGLGSDFWGHHFTFAIPVLTALALRGADSMNKLIHRPQLFALSTATAAVLLSGTQLQANVHETDWYQRRHWEVYRTAEAIDRVLDACDIEDYVFIGGNDMHPFVYTDHVPKGPLYVQYEYWMNNPEHTFYKAFISNLNEAKFIVHWRENQLADIRGNTYSYLEHQFSRRPWPCAQEALAGFQSRYRFFFRNSGPYSSVAAVQP